MKVRVIFRFFQDLLKVFRNISFYFIGNILIEGNKGQILHDVELMETL